MTAQQLPTFAFSDYCNNHNEKRVRCARDMASVCSPAAAPGAVNVVSSSALIIDKSASMKRICGCGRLNIGGYASERISRHVNPTWLWACHQYPTRGQSSGAMTGRRRALKRKKLTRQPFLIPCYTNVGHRPIRLSHGELNELGPAAMLCQNASASPASAPCTVRPRMHGMN